MAQLCSSGFAHLHKLNYFNVQIFHLSTITFANVQLNALPICTVSHMGCERRLSVCLAYCARHTVPVPISMLKRPQPMQTNSSVQEHITKLITTNIAKIEPSILPKIATDIVKTQPKILSVCPGVHVNGCTQCRYA